MLASLYRKIAMLNLVPKTLEYATPGTFQFVVPSNITVIRVRRIIGSGGGGGGGHATGGGGGGGGGGSSVLDSDLDVTPGDVLSLVVGDITATSRQAWWTTVVNALHNRMVRLTRVDPDGTVNLLLDGTTAFSF